jgi:hypothetical protein
MFSWSLAEQVAPTHVQLPPVALGQHNSPRPNPTKTGKPRQCIKWDDEINTFIMRSYYIHTENEINMVMYRQKIHQAFVAQYPNIRVTEQRIAGQRRANYTEEIVIRHNN